MKRVFLLFLILSKIFICSQCFGDLKEFSTDFPLSLDIPKNPLKWAVDPHCPPLIFRNPLNFDALIGAEAEIREEIIKILGEESALFLNEYESLIPSLIVGFYDVVFGSLTISSEKAREVLYCKPHIFTYGRLFTHKTSGINKLSDCQGKRVGVIRTTELESFLQQVPGVTIIPYSFEMLAFRDLNYNRLDAILIEVAYGNYYTYSTPDVISVGEPIGHLEYAFAVHKNDYALKDKLDTAIDILYKNGKLREILQRWGLWTSRQAQFMGVPYEPVGNPVDFIHYAQIVNFETTWKDRFKLYEQVLPRLLKASVMTLKVSILSMLFAMALGFALALAKIYGRKPIRWMVNAYIEVFRGTPLLIQLLFIFYGLPLVGVILDPLLAAILGLGLNYAAYEAEIYRAGLLSVPSGQMEAARALGMSHVQSLIHVVIPQAIRIVIPPVTNDFISLLKDSSLVSVITITELTFVYNHVASTYYDYFGTGILVAILYLCLGVPFIMLSRFTEKRLGRYLK